MYDYIKGEIVEISPTEVILECNGIGYSIMISLQTYDALKESDEAKVYIYHHIREDEEQFYGRRMSANCSNFSSAFPE